MTDDPRALSSADDLLREAAWVRRLARRLARDQASAEDLAQGTLTLGIERAPSANTTSRESLRPWLARVMQRLAANERRREARRTARERRAAGERSSTEPASDALLERLELQEQLARAVRSLPEPYREVVLRRYYEGESTAQIARATGRTPATVRSQLVRGLDRLRLGFAQGLARGESNDDSSRFGALGALTLLGGSDPSSLLLPRVGAQLVTMKTSTKIAASAAAVAALSLVIAPKLAGGRALEPTERPAALGGTELVQPEVDAHDLAEVDGDETRSVVDVDPPDESIAAPTLEDTEALTLVRARLTEPGGRARTEGQLASIYADGRPRGTASPAAANPDGRVELELQDGDLRAFRTQVYPMIFAATAPFSATEFVVGTPPWRGELDLGDVELGPGGTLTGAVVDRAGRAIPGALLYASSEVPPDDLDAARLAGPDLGIPRPRAESTDAGRFEALGIAPGEVRLWVHAPGYLWTLSDALEVLPRASRDVGALVLDEVGTEQRIEVLVRRPNGEPAPGARIDFEVATAQQEGHILADSAGRALVVPKRAALTALTARDPSGTYSPSRTLGAEPGEAVELQLAPRRVVAVHVIDPDGAPIAEAATMPFLPEAPGSPWDFDGLGRTAPGASWIRTDAAGYMEVPVPGEPFNLSVSRQGYLAQRLGPFEPESAPDRLEITLVPEPRITGRVLAYGQPVSGAKITVGQRIEGFVPREQGFPMRFFVNQQHDSVSDENGVFECPVDEEWTDVTVLALPPRGEEDAPGFALGETELTLVAGEGAEGVVIEVTGGGSIHGVVLPPPGRSAAGIVVAASRGDGLPVSTRTNKDGEYRLAGLTPGPWRVEGRDREPSREVLSVAQRDEDKEFNWNVDVTDGGDVRFDVDMRELGDVEVDGVLLIDGAAPPAGWRAEVAAPFGAIARTETVSVPLDEGGRFVLTTPAGFTTLRLVGELEGGARVEVLREVTLRGPRQAWSGELKTGRIAETVEGAPEEVRLVRGNYYEGDREITRLDPKPGGELEARVPAGSSSLQAPDPNSPFGGWKYLRMIEIQ